MSNIAVTGGATGTGTVTLLAPNTSTNRTLTLPDSTGTVATAETTLTQFNASGSAPVYACRAWVNFNGTGTVAIRGSGNVTSITDNGVGLYTVNFTTAMSDVNYAVTGFARKSATDDANPLLLSANHTYTFTTSAVQVKTVVGSWTFTDGLTVCVAIFR